jgi:hypothetical protein
MDRCLIRLLLLVCATATVAPTALGQTDLQRAQNLATCLGGRYPALCKKGWLSPEERQKTEAAERRENLSTCLLGRYPNLCNRALLTAAERSEVAAAERRENLKTCLTGRYRALCNQSLLTAEERGAVKAAEAQENLKTCLTGRFPASCDRQSLTREQLQEVHAAEARARANASTRANTGRGAIRSRPGSSGCESGNWVESVSDDGRIVKLSDGSIWEIDAVDRIDSMLWLPTTDIIACADKLINTEDNESVSARRLR